MPHFKFPCHYVYWGQVKDHENIKSKLLPIINSLISDNNYENPFGGCSMTTNFSKKTSFLDNEMSHHIIKPTEYIIIGQNDFEVVIFDDLSNSTEKTISRIHKITGVTPTFVKVDLKDPVATSRAIEAHKEASGVIHFAAHKAVGESVQKPLMYYTNNFYSLLNICLNLCLGHSATRRNLS